MCFFLYYKCTKFINKINNNENHTNKHMYIEMYMKMLRISMIKDINNLYRYHFQFGGVLGYYSVVCLADTLHHLLTNTMLSKRPAQRTSSNCRIDKYVDRYIYVHMYM